MAGVTSEGATERSLGKYSPSSSMYTCTVTFIYNRPGVAGAVLQTASSLVIQLTE